MWGGGLIYLTVQRVGPAQPAQRDEPAVADVIRHCLRYISSNVVKWPQIGMSCQSELVPPSTDRAADGSSVPLLRVRADIIGHARSKYVVKSQSRMVYNGRFIPQASCGVAGTASTGGREQS